MNNKYIFSFLTLLIFNIKRKRMGQDKINISVQVLPLFYKNILVSVWLIRTNNSYLLACHLTQFGRIVTQSFLWGKTRDEPIDSKGIDLSTLHETRITGARRSLTVWTARSNLVSQVTLAIIFHIIFKSPLQCVRSNTLSSACILNKITNVAFLTYKDN